jgi:hypothetical protein
MRRIKTNKIEIILLLFFGIFVSCNGQIKQKMKFSCGNSNITIELPKIKNKKEQSFTEGKTTLLTTIDNVIIEYYCGGNYSSHIRDKEKYKFLYKKGNSKFGINTETGLYWRKKGKIIYSNCKASDTVVYNKAFDKALVYQVE